MLFTDETNNAKTVKQWNENMLKILYFITASGFSSGK